MSRQLNQASKTSLADEYSSFDETVSSVVHEIIKETNQIDDPLLKEMWSDAVQTFARTGDIGTLVKVTELRRPVVPLEEFMFDKLYLGMDEAQIYPGVIQTCMDLDNGDYVEAVLKGALGGGKQLCVDTPILTDKGWKRNGDIQTGDKVYDETGNLCTVTKAHDIKIPLKAYRVNFSDETHIDACAEHLWWTVERTLHGPRDNGSVKTTEDIAGTLVRGGQTNHTIPLISGVYSKPNEVHLDPYVLGAWLGDGSSDRPMITCHNSDYEVIERIEACGYIATLCDHADKTKCPQYKLITRMGYPVKDALRFYGLLQNKHIPEDYLYGSHEQRVNLLQGLMDTDGHMRQTGSCEIIQVNKTLAMDILQLLWLLGLKPKIRIKYVSDTPYYRITFTAHRNHIQAFRLTRKLNLQPYSGAQAVRQRSRYIVSVDPIEPKPMRCLSVDSKSHLYLVGRQMVATHNTTIANIMMARELYKLSCMRHPQTTFGIQSKSSIVFTIQSVRFNTAKKAVFDEFGQYLNHSPYFSKMYPYDKRITSQMIFREQNVSILPVASSTTGAISMNVIGGILDEMNFMSKITKSKSSYADSDGGFDQAQQLYNTLSKRRRSRFARRGKLPGMLFLVSSSRYPTDFTEIKAQESTMLGGKDPKIYVYSKSQWEARGRDVFLPGNFRVQIGNDTVRSKVLADGEEPKAGASVVEVPEDFRIEFDKDCDGALRDLAGITILATHPFILKRDSIMDCMIAGEKAGYVNPYNVESLDLSFGVPKPNKDLLRTDVKQFRTCHIDLGLTKDAAGIAIGHIAGMKAVNKSDEDGEDIVEILPVIAIDVVLRVVPPVGGEIEFSKIRKLILQLRDRYNLDIKYITTDGFQAVDTRQILRGKGFHTDYLSVSKVEPYRSLRDVLYEGRLLLPKHQFLAKELAELEVSIVNNKEKVDHRPDGSNDVADAVCGVVSFLLSRRAAWSQYAFSGVEGTTLFGDPTLVNKLLQDKNDEVSEATHRTRRPKVKRKKSRRKSLLRKNNSTTKG